MKRDNQKKHPVAYLVGKSWINIYFGPCSESKLWLFFGYSTKMSSGSILQCPGFCVIAKSALRAMYWPKRELPSGCCLQCWAGTWTTHQHHSSNYLLGMPKQHENQQKVCPNVCSYIWRYTLFEDMLQIDAVLIQLPMGFKAAGVRWLLTCFCVAGADCNKQIILPICTNGQQTKK